MRKGSLQTDRKRKKQVGSQLVFYPGCFFAEKNWAQVRDKDKRMAARVLHLGAFILCIASMCALLMVYIVGTQLSIRKQQ